MRTPILYIPPTDEHGDRQRIEIGNHTIDYIYETYSDTVLVNSRIKISGDILHNTPVKLRKNRIQDDVQSDFENLILKGV